VRIKHFKDFLRKYVLWVIKGELGHFEEKFVKQIQIFWSKRSYPDRYNYSGSDLAEIFGSHRIRIHNSDKVDAVKIVSVAKTHWAPEPLSASGKYCIVYILFL
jgi:hypothetical protein